MEKSLKNRHKYAKSLRLTSEQLVGPFAELCVNKPMFNPSLQKSLKLKYGSNTVKFEVASGIQGKAICRAKIFLWKHDAKVVISDVDGTITKYVQRCYCYSYLTQSF